MLTNNFSERIVLGLLDFRKLSQKEISLVLDNYFNMGGKYIDGALLYGGEDLAKCLGEIIACEDYPAIINYKIGYFLNKKDFNSDIAFIQKIDYLKNIFKEKLKLISLHEVDWKIWWNPDCNIKDIVTNVEDFVTKSHINYVKNYVNSLDCKLGYTSNNASSLELVINYLKPDFFLIAKQFDLLWRNAYKILSNDFYPDLGKFVASPYHQGWLFDLKNLAKKIPRYKENINILNRMLEEENINISEIAIIFQVLIFSKTKIVVGIKNIDELTKLFNLFSCDFQNYLELCNNILDIGIEQKAISGPISF